SFFATLIVTTPAWPFRTVSTSACMTRMVVPHPALHCGHTPGFSSASPGVRSSSGTNRISSCSGLPQLASVTAPPVTAVSLMKFRRSMIGNDLEMTREAVVRRLLLAMTVHAESHRVIDLALGHRHLGDVTVTVG